MQNYSKKLSKNIQRCGKSQKAYHMMAKDKPDENGRVINTLEYAIAWGVQNKPYTKSDLIKMCSAPDAPSFLYLMREFTTYERYYKALLKAGMEPRPLWRKQSREMELEKEKEKAERLSFFSTDVDYARIAAEYGVMQRSQYRNLRNSNEDMKKILPTERVITKIYGSFARFLVEVMKYNADAVITKYVELSYQQGKWLTLRECDKNSLPIRSIMDILRPVVFNTLCYHKMRLMHPEFDKQCSKE